MLCLLAVRCPAIMQIRKELGLSPHSYNIHMRIAEKVAKEKPEEEVVKGFEKLCDDKVTKKLSENYQHFRYDVPCKLRGFPIDEKRGGVTFNPLCEHEPCQENAETFMEGLNQVLIMTLLCPIG